MKVFNCYTEAMACETCNYSRVGIPEAIDNDYAGFLLIPDSESLALQY